MYEVQFQPSRSRKLGFAFAAFAVLAVFASLFWINRADSEAKVEGARVSAEQGSTEIAPAGNEITGGFSDRWFPLIQAVPLSVAATGPQLADGAAAEFVPISAEERSTFGPAPDLQTQQQATIPLPRRRPALADEFRVPLPRSRPNGPAPQSVFMPLIDLVNGWGRAIFPRFAT
jgi:hypothetical protein